MAISRENGARLKVRAARFGYHSPQRGRGFDADPPWRFATRASTELEKTMNGYAPLSKGFEKIRDMIVRRAVRQGLSAFDDGCLHYYGMSRNDFAGRLKIAAGGNGE